MASLRLLAKEQNKTVTEVMEPFKAVLANMVPPKNDLLKHQPAIAQPFDLIGFGPKIFDDMGQRQHQRVRGYVSWHTT